jgi:hypothetical protein
VATVETAEELAALLDDLAAVDLLPDSSCAPRHDRFVEG